MAAELLSLWFTNLCVAGMCALAIGSSTVIKVYEPRDSLRIAFMWFFGGEAAASVCKTLEKQGN